MIAIDESPLTETSVQLLREFERTGESAPFEAFMRRHAAMVYATCLKVTRDPHDAEDATQATFLTLASKSRLNGEIRQPEAWLRKVAHRLSLDLIRSKKRRINRENLRSEMTSEAAPLDSSDHAGNGELKGILNEELAKLPASYRMPLILHYFGGLSREEMADQLKLKPSTLGVRLHRAREQLRKRLSSRGIALPAVALTALLVEVVRGSVCSHLMHSTARQASAIVMGHASAPVFAAGPGFQSLRLLSDLIGGSKLRVLASLLVLGSAISMTSGQVQQLLPKLIRDLLPTYRTPAIPRLQFTLPMPKLVADAGNRDVDVLINSSPLPGYKVSGGLPLSVTSANAFAAPDESGFFSGPINVNVPVVSAMPIAIAPIGAVSSTARSSATSLNVVVNAPPTPVIVKSSGSSFKTAPAATVRVQPDPVKEVPTGGSSAPAPSRDAWNSVIAASTTTDSTGPTVPAASPASSEGAPEGVVAAVVGSVPSLSGRGGGAAGSDSQGSAHVSTNLQTPPRTAIASRTATFAGTSANYGGYADASWAQSHLLDLSNSLLTSVPAEDYSFSPPIVPGEAETLSINGARVTLHNASSEDPVSISFVDTSSTKIPTLPDGHHFIGVWQFDTLSSYEAIDLLVRYDDLRAARLGLSEQILKLWVSDGETWTLMWHDKTFGRDVYKNLLWVTADSDVKFFAVSAPEPAALTMLVAAGTLLAGRRRRA